MGQEGEKRNYVIILEVQRIKIVNSAKPYLLHSELSFRIFHWANVDIMLHLVTPHTHTHTQSCAKDTKLLT